MLPNSGHCRTSPVKPGNEGVAGRLPGISGGLIAGHCRDIAGTLPGIAGHCRALPMAIAGDLVYCAPITSFPTIPNFNTSGHGR